MSQLTTRLLLADRAKVISLLKRVAKSLKKSDPDQKLAVYHDNIARSYGYSNWSMLHKNAEQMTLPQFEAFVALVVQNVDVQKVLLSQPEFFGILTVKCRLFSKSLGYLADEFSDGEPQAIVLSDSKKVQEMMESNGVYYYNAGKVHMNKELLRKGFFEVPLVVPTEGNLEWVEGFHQVNAALEMGVRIVPMGTSLALAQHLSSLVGASNRNTVASPFDFSECDATVI